MPTHLGLTSAEAKTLQQKYGKNELPEKHQQTLLSVFLSQFKSPLVFVLIIVSIVTFFLHEYTDTVVILIVVSINACIGTFQELKALNSLQSLKELLTPKTKVYRDGELSMISAEDLVPSDIVLIEAGDRVPADGVLIEAKGITVNEAQLTGEAYPVTKDTEKNANVAMGTLVASGRGVFRVEKIGESTSLGLISKEVVKHIAEATPLERQLQKLLDKVLIIVSVMCALIFLIGFTQGFELKELFKIAVSIGVSAIPEGLPIVVTVTLALGVLRMSKKRAILSNLPSVSTLAGVDVICTDKTGTLTEGRIVLHEMWVFVKNTLQEKQDTELLRYAVLCNDAQIGKEKIGDLLDISLLESATKEKLAIQNVRMQTPRIGEIPFDSDNRWQATLHEDGKSRLMIVKGAPECLLPLCTGLSPAQRKHIEQKVLDLSSEGYRVLALATKTSASLSLHQPKDVHSLTFQGILVFSDKIRHDAAAAVKKCQDSGIQVIMITGDHLSTAKSIARQAHLYRDGDIALSGEQLRDTSHYTTSLANLKVVARATPFDKSGLIDQLKAEHKLVAMTGDGVNDAPALAKADIGIAMGKSGTDAAREAADMVLVDDAFSTIVDGISSARGIFENIRKVISYLFTTSYGELAVIFFSMILQFPLPLIAVQILWLNVITDGLFDIAIATETHETGIMKISHYRYKGHIIDKLLLLRIMLLGTVMAVGTMVMFLSELNGNGLAYAQTSALIVLAIYQWFHAFNARHESKSIFELGVFTNKAVTTTLVFEALLLYLAVYNPIFQQFLKTVPVRADVWIEAVFYASSVVIVEELRKYLFRKYGWDRYFTRK